MASSALAQPTDVYNTLGYHCHPLLPPQYFHQLPPPSGLVSTSYGPDYIPQPSRRGPALVLCQGLVRLYPI